MRRRRVLAALALTPFLALPSGCGDNDAAPSEKTSTPVKPTSSVTISPAQREWQLSSKDKQEAYCRAYTQHSITTPQDLGMPSQDADEEFVEDFLALLKEKC